MQVPPFCYYHDKKLTDWAGKEGLKFNTAADSSMPCQPHRPCLCQNDTSATTEKTSTTTTTTDTTISQRTSAASTSKATNTVNGDKTPSIEATSTSTTYANSTEISATPSIEPSLTSPTNAAEVYTSDSIEAFSTSSPGSTIPTSPIAEGNMADIYEIF